jgi:hypothetical protein
MKATAAAALPDIEIKVVGKSGQISLGKSHAGRILRLERRTDGTLVLTPAAMVPETQLWTLEEPDRSRIQRGLAWAARTPAQETRLDGFLKGPAKGNRRARARRP